MLIKCPECGHQVSDKAPLCPNCGVEIAGKVSKCPKCGEVYASEEGGCPNCSSQERDDGTSMPVVTAMPIEEEEVVARPVSDTYEGDNEFSGSDEERERNNGNKGGGHSTLLVSLLIAAIICGVGLYFYKDAVDRMDASGKEVVAVKDTIAPSPDVDIIDDKDTVPEVPAVEEKTSEPKTEDEVAGEEKKQEDSGVTAEESEKAKESVRRFLRAINSHNKDALTASVASFLTSFNGKSSATKYDVLQYMADLYQADVKNLNWHIDEVSDVEKRENAEGKTEYVITIKATKETAREGGTSKHKFKIKATVDADRKISAANIARE